MGQSALKGQLEQLLELLQQERICTQALDMPGLHQVVQAKNALVGCLEYQPEDVAGLEGLLRKIDEENRRNAFLLWTGLNWVRDLMGFFGKAALPQTYGDAGQYRTLTEGGRLLSGRV